jgi:hypothetical protein
MLQSMFLTMSLSGLLLLSGCAGSISLSDYRQEVQLQAAERLPTVADLDNQSRAKVVVFETDDSNLVRARRAQAATTLSRSIEQLLGANGAEVIDRDVAAQLGQELQLAEVKGVAGYEGPALANFAVKSTITLADYGSEYVPATSYTDKTGKTYITPASFTHRATVNLSLRVYEIPSLRLLKTLNGRGASTQSTRDRGSHELASTLIRYAAQSALNNVRAELLDLFAPKGYVIGRRDNGGKSIFRISIGSDQGIVAGNRLMIFTEQADIHPITQKISYDKIPVVEGYVTPIVSANEAWIVATDRAKAKTVRLGDRIEVVHKSSGIGNLFRFGP